MNNTKTYRRFDLAQRIEHWILFLSFTTLAVTGLPQKFADSAIGATMIGWFGGIEMTRQIHHIAAIVMLVEIAYHAVNIGYRVFVLRVNWSMFPQLQDAWDGLNTALYNLGLRKAMPRYDHFTYAEKVEYWALIWGTVIMAITGFILWNPIITSRFLPGEYIPTAKAAHGGEAILAVLAILIWHLYNVHVKMFNQAMFKGTMPEHQMEEEHALELERVSKGVVARPISTDVIARRQRVFLPIALVGSFALLFGVYLFTTSETTAVTTVPTPQNVQVFVPRTSTPRATSRATATRAPGTTPVATQPAAGGPKALPASHVGRTQCQVCHLTGVGGAPKNPADHAGRDDATCSTCHKPANLTEQATTVPALAVSAKALPADHAGRAVCLVCHTTGVNNSPKVPADHAGRLDASCSDCHKSK
ncbi:MAG TPA: cytochrome b/b6 domain-containing protein [Anaerolineae bacterium]